MKPRARDQVTSLWTRTGFQTKSFTGCKALKNTDSLGSELIFLLSWELAMELFLGILNGGGF